MGEMKQLAQAIYGSHLEAVAALYDFLLGDLAHTSIYESFAVSPNAPALGDKFVTQTPANPYFKSQFLWELAQPAAHGLVVLQVSMSPRVDAAANPGGWTGGSWQAPNDGPVYLPMLNGSGLRFTVIGDDAMVIPVAWWTPAAEAPTLTFDAATQRITRSAGSYITTGLCKGQPFAVTGTVSNNKTFILKQYISSTVIEVEASPALVNEGPVACTLTPREAARFVYGGRLQPAYAKSIDAYPAALWGGVWGTGKSILASESAGGQDLHSPRYGWQRLWDNGAAVVNATTGEAAWPSFPVIDPFTDQPDTTSVPSYLSYALELGFKQTISGTPYRLYPGRPSGVFWTDRTRTGRQVETIALPGGASREVSSMARDGVVIPWPEASNTRI